MKTILDERDREILRQIWSAGSLSRTDLRDRTGQTPNAVGDRVRLLVEAGLLRELPAMTASAVGRPKVPVSIDVERRVVMGLALSAGGVTCARYDLSGAVRGEPTELALPKTSRPGEIASAAARVLKAQLDDQALVIGVSATGFVDPEAAALLGTTDDVRASRAQSTVLSRLIKIAGGRPVVLQNDMQALAAAWRMMHGEVAEEDVLLVRLEDGAVGGALLVNGRPNRGCVAGANEIGHMRLGVDAPRCYCGGVGCLERVCSSEYLRKLGGRGELATRLAEVRDDAVGHLMNLVAEGIAGAVNFVRPHRLVLVGPLVSDPLVVARWRELVAARVLGPIRERMSIETPADANLEPVAAAGWLALAHLYTADWPAVVAAPSLRVVR